MAAANITSQKEADLDRACAIDGWLTRREAAVLYGLAHNAPGPVVEIGSWQGRSTAALALGSMAGRRQPVYAVDPFLGPHPGDRRTSLGNDVAGLVCSPAVLRDNLDAAGVNGLVRVVPKRSEAALADVPDEIGLLFVDGAHDYESVCRDIDNYLPRLKMGGFAVFHDVAATDRDVARAIDDRVRSRPNELRVIDHVDSALVVRRVNTAARSVVLLCPGRGYDWGTVTGIARATLGAHRVALENNGNGWDDFNALWARALNRFDAGEITHAAMLHSDIVPSPGFVDLLMDEIEELGLDFLSVACAMKDRRGLCNCGVGAAGNRWGAWRRLTVRELLTLPPTFGLDDLATRGFCGDDPADKVLLHNTGCFVADLRSGVFHQTGEGGDLAAWFDFPTRVRKDERTGTWKALRESEDWFFSRQLHELGADTRITRKVTLVHEGKGEYPNNAPWGEYEAGDEGSRHLWGAETSPPL